MLDLRRTVLCDAGRSVADLSISPSGHLVAVCFGNDDQTGTPVAIYDSETGRLSQEAQQQQQDAVAEGRSQIDTAQQETMSQQQAEIERVRNQATSDQQRALSDIDGRISADQASIEAKVAEAESKAQSEASKGEADIESIRPANRVPTGTAAR